VWVYLAAVAAGLLLGTTVPAVGGSFEVAVLPTIAVLLYVTFTQVPLNRLPAAARDARFLGIVVVANFVLVPLFVWVLVSVLPDDPALRVGVLLVLLVPCTDWFLTFSHLAGGATPRALAATPVLLMSQLLLLPLYLWAILGQDFGTLVGVSDVARTFALLVVAPLIAAWLTQVLQRRMPFARAVVTHGAHLPVPLLATVLLLIASSQVTTVLDQLPLLPMLAGAFVAYLAFALVLGLALGKVFRLDTGASRTLIFSLGTRNSFVVLPLALALPFGAHIAVVVVVFQSLVELFGMMAYLRLVPWLTRDDKDAGTG
jgi:ACR3 family arsenite efflux pump ArsB